MQQLCKNCRHWNPHHTERAEEADEGTCYRDYVRDSIYPDVVSICRLFGSDVHRLSSEQYRKLYNEYYSFVTSDTFYCAAWEAKDG